MSDPQQLHIRLVPASAPILSAWRKKTLSPADNPLEDSKGLRDLSTSSLNARCAAGVIASYSWEKSVDRSSVNNALLLGKVQRTALVVFLTFLKPDRCICRLSLGRFDQ